MKRILPALAVLLAGCGSLPAERSIRIDLPAAAAAQPLAGKNLSLRLLRLDAEGVLQERNLAYVEAGAPTEVRQAATITWESSPDVAAAAYLSAALRGAGAGVIAVETPGTPAFNLSGTVQRFELVGGGNTGMAVVAMDIRVDDLKFQPWLNASYCAAVPGRDRSVAAVQVAFTAALAEVTSHLISDLAARAGGGAMPPFVPRGSRLGTC
ncbi:MAG: membrane integrity-associated transporter subunit PqiC [Alphaproteobacteria bacterium]|nr:membrane integrity-associated transporter subunit PqiC [Alphaproteobacteria bacterium]